MAENDLGAALAAPSDAFEVAPHQAEGMEQFGRKGAVATMLADERAKQEKAHYMWDEGDRAKLRTGNNLPIPTDKRNKQTGFDGRLPFKGPYPGGFYVQNRKIFKGKTTQVSLKDVPEKLMTQRRKMGSEVFEAEEVRPRELVAFALQLGDSEILAGDPLRCKICIEYRGSSDISLMTHFRSKHPTELDQLVEGVTRMEAERDGEEAQEPPPPRKQAKQTFRAGA